MSINLSEYPSQIAERDSDSTDEGSTERDVDETVPEDGNEYFENDKPLVESVFGAIATLLKRAVVLTA